MSQIRSSLDVFDEDQAFKGVCTWGDLQNQMGWAPSFQGGKLSMVKVTAPLPKSGWRGPLSHLVLHADRPKYTRLRRGCLRR